MGDDDDGDASQVRGAGRGVGGAARDDGGVGVSDDDVGAVMMATRVGWRRRRRREA